MILIINYKFRLIGRLSIIPVDPEVELGMLVLDVPVTVWEWVAFDVIAYVFWFAILLAYVENFTSYELFPESPPPMSILFTPTPVFDVTINGA